MEKVEKAAPKKEEPVAVPNHTEKITSQVLAKIGKPPRLDRVEVSRHHNGNYRVNIWEQPEPNKNIAVTIGARIRSSYYLKVSDTGEIIDSNPPLTNCALRLELALPRHTWLDHRPLPHSSRPLADLSNLRLHGMTKPDFTLHRERLLGSASKTPGRHDADGR